MTLNFCCAVIAANTPMETIPIAKMVNIMAMIQSSPPIETAAKSEKNWLLVLAAWIVISALITGVLTVLLYKKTSAYQLAVKSEADAQIAIAKAEAAKANEGLAKSNEEIARLTRDAEALRADAETARANIATAQRDAAQANERTQKLAIEAAEARRRQAEAERLLLELKERVKPRRLTQEQAQRLFEFLKDKPKGRVEIVYPAGNNEAFNLANDIHMQAMMGSGWEVKGPNPDQTQRPWSDVRVEASHIEDGTPAELLRTALTFAGIPTAGAKNITVPEGLVILFIGQPFVKPFPE